MMGEANYHAINDAVSDLDDQIDALQKAKRDLWANVRDEHGKKIADQIKLAVKLNRLGNDKRMERDEIEDGAFRILSILQQPRAPRATPAREIIEEFDAETGEIPEPVQEMHKLPEGEATASQFQAKASEDNGATGTANDEVPSDSMAGEVSRVDAGRTASATSDYGRDSVERHATNSPSATLLPPGDADKAEAGSSHSVSAPIPDEGIPAFLKRDHADRKPEADKPDCLKLKGGRCKIGFATDALCSECAQKREKARAA